MKYTTIQVTPQMRRRLARYKLPGMSYEAVIDVLTDAIPPETFRVHHRRALRTAKVELSTVARGRSDRAAAEEARGFERDRIARMSPGERMEEAYRLFALLRGRA